MAASYKVRNPTSSRYSQHLQIKNNNKNEPKTKNGEGEQKEEMREHGIHDTHKRNIYKVISNTKGQSTSEPLFN